MELSRILDKVHGIGAGILSLYDIININKKTYPEEVRSFFQVMEVYGFGTEIEFRASSTHSLLDNRSNQRSRSPVKKEEKVDNLKYLRKKSLDQITQVSHSVMKTVALIKDLPKAPGSVNQQISAE